MDKQKTSGQTKSKWTNIKVDKQKTSGQAKSKWMKKVKVDE